MLPANVRRVVAMGGGHGLARGLEALTRLELAPTAVVTVADDGGSTGRLRRELDIIAPGDLRKALIALARNRPLADVLTHRFARGWLEGHPLGNLLLVALAEQEGGDFVRALERAAGLLDCAGRVLPATVEQVQLKARVAGTQVDGQARVARSGGRIERVWLEPGDPVATEEAVAAVEAADLVVLGPGSLFTSVIATLLVPALADALAATAARVVHVVNIRTQPGETSGLDASTHVEEILAHVPRLRLDAVVVHDGPVGDGGAVTGEVREDLVPLVVRADVVARRDGRPGWEHDPARLARALASTLARLQPSR